MAVSQTLRLALTRWGLGTDPLTRAQLDADHAELEAVVAKYAQGALAARTAAEAKHEGTYFTVTDPAGGGRLGAVYYCTGAAWLEVNVPAAADAVSYSGSTDLVAANVEAALDELDAEKISITAANAAYPLRAPNWVTGRAYQLGELVINAGTLYRTSTAHASAGAFDATKFTASGGAASPLILTASAAAEKPLTVKGAASQSGNLFEAQESTGVVRVLVDEIGRLAVGNVNGLNPTAALTVVSPYSNEQGLVVKGGSGQTANLAEFQNSAGGLLNIIRAGGQVAITPDAGASTPLFVKGITASTVVAEFRGAASQSANLAEFQNSAGTVLAQVLATGNIGMTAITTGDTSLGLRNMKVGAADSGGSGFRAVVVSN